MRLSAHAQTAESVAKIAYVSQRSQNIVNLCHRTPPNHEIVRTTKARPGSAGRGLSNSRTRIRGPFFGPFLAARPPVVGQNPGSRRPRRRRGRRKPGFCPIPGGREAKIGPKMGPWSRVRLLLRPRRTQGTPLISIAQTANQTVQSHGPTAPSPPGGKGCRRRGAHVHLQHGPNSSSIR